MEYDNKFMVGTTGDGQILIQRIPVGPISPLDALLLAAWLVTLAEYKTDRTFQNVLDEVQSI